MLSFVESGKARLITRRGNDYTQKFKTEAQALEQLGRSFIADGEMMPKSQQYIVFDLLALDGEDLRDRPLTERKAMLEQLLADAPGTLQYSLHIEDHGTELFEQACAANLEGIVAKCVDGFYTGKREWLKIKCENYTRGGNDDGMVEGVTITSPKKIFSHEPRVTKLDLVQYYQAVAPYSVRMQLGLPVSCPIAWSELGKVVPAGIDMAEALLRLKRKDPWES